MIVECIEPECFELTERASCLCEKHEAQSHMQCGAIALFLKLFKPRKQQHRSHA